MTNTITALMGVFILLLAIVGSSQPASKDEQQAQNEVTVVDTPAATEQTEIDKEA